MVDRHTGKHAPPPPMPSTEGIPGLEEEREPAIVKVKAVELKPMAPEEAILQMELLGHDFFVFTSDETGSTSVLYRRHDGDYGLIEPQV